MGKEDAVSPASPSSRFGELEINPNGSSEVGDGGQGVRLGAGLCSEVPGDGSSSQPEPAAA